MRRVNSALEVQSYKSFVMRAIKKRKKRVTDDGAGAKRIKAAGHQAECSKFRCDAGQPFAGGE